MRLHLRRYEVHLYVGSVPSGEGAAGKGAGFGDVRYSGALFLATVLQQHSQFLQPVEVVSDRPRALIERFEVASASFEQQRSTATTASSLAPARPVACLRAGFRLSPIVAC